jgi:peptide/nickel transport system ATP-binding protein
VSDDIKTGSMFLHADDVSVRFTTAKGTITAVDGASFSLAQGEGLGVVGETGSGKTILTRRVMGLVGPGRNTVLSGKVTMDGTELTRLSPKQLREYWGKEIAVILQDPMTSLNPVRRVGSQLMESVRYGNRLSRNEARKRAIELFRSVGLPDAERQLRRFPHELSGGMRQRVAIAIALASEPRVLLADEPTTALDVTVAARILDLLRTKQREAGMTMILVSHDLRAVRGRTDRAIVMYAGQIVESAATSALFADPKVPYSRALLDSVPPRSGPNHLRLQAVPGKPPDPINPPRGCRFSPRCPYAQEKCVAEAPPLMATKEGDRLYRCWFPLGTPEGEKARKINLERGRTATGLPLVPNEGVHH